MTSRGLPCILGASTSWAATAGGDAGSLSASNGPKTHRGGFHIKQVTDRHLRWIQTDKPPFFYGFSDASETHRSVIVRIPWRAAERPPRICEDFLRFRRESRPASWVDFFKIIFLKLNVFFEKYTSKKQIPEIPNYTARVQFWSTKKRFGVPKKDFGVPKKDLEYQKNILEYQKIVANARRPLRGLPRDSKNYTSVGF